MRQDQPDAPTLWIDITELFGEFALTNHPTGISRVIINLSDALAADRGKFGKVRPVFWHPVLRQPLTVEDPGLGSLSKFFLSLRAEYARHGATIRPMQSGLKKGLITSIPKPIRFRLFPYLNGVTRFLAWARKADIRIGPIELGPRDCLFVPGSFWLDGYASRLAGRARAKGVAVVAFVHDVLLLSNPEWLPSHHGQQFRRGVETFLPRCTAIVSNSAYTRDEVTRHVPGLNAPITVCRLADSGPASATMHFPEAIATLADQRYALLVSTLTPRKNHRLAVAAWQKLWNMLGPETPWLVCVGGGAPDPALAELLSQSISYGDRIVRLTDVDDVTLEGLYANAWMTVYPSLGEGYGLPVAEALARGKVCLATGCGGIGEVAPDLVDSISATNPEELAKRVSYYVENPARMAAREELIRKHYRRTRWEETAQAVRWVLEDAIACAGGQRPSALVEGRY